MPFVPLNEIMERSRALISAAEENVCRAKLLCDLVHETLYDNAEVRDLLLEARITALSARERRRPGSSASEPNRQRSRPHSSAATAG